MSGMYTNYLGGKWSSDDRSCSSRRESHGPKAKLLSIHHHSIWRYLSFQYAFFCECDCVVVETGPQGCGDEVYTALWDTATKMFLNDAQLAVSKEGNLRYFIVGNSIDGYNGIERDMGIGSWRDQSGMTRWAYRHVERDHCKRVLAERCFALGI